MNTDDQMLDEASSLNLAKGDSLSPGAAAAITKAAKWTKYYLMIIIAYFVLVLLMQLLGIGSLGSAGGLEAAGIGVVGILFSYAIIFAIVGYPLVKLWKFATETPRAIANENQSAFRTGVDGLRSAYKFFGVLLFIVLGFYGIVLIGALFFGAFSAFGG